jgi:hypothetical protein
MPVAGGIGAFGVLSVTGAAARWLARQDTYNATALSRTRAPAAAYQIVFFCMNET